MLPVALSVSRFETKIFDISPYLRLIMIGAKQDTICIEVTMFVAAYLHASISIPLLGRLRDRHYPKPQPRFFVPCVRWYLRLSSRSM